MRVSRWKSRSAQPPLSCCSTPSLKKLRIWSPYGRTLSLQETRSGMVTTNTARRTQMHHSYAACFFQPSLSVPSCRVVDETFDRSSTSLPVQWHSMRFNSNPINVSVFFSIRRIFYTLSVISTAYFCSLWRYMQFLWRYMQFLWRVAIHDCTFCSFVCQH